MPEKSLGPPDKFPKTKEIREEKKNNNNVFLKKNNNGCRDGQRKKLIITKKKLWPLWTEVNGWQL